MKVLIVDDEPDVLHSTTMLVESLGYQAVAVSDPAEILDAIAREQPGVLLQDLKMPDLNVAGLVAALRSEAATAELPIVFFSANADLPATAMRYEAWGYLPKPFTIQQLQRVLEEATGVRPASNRAAATDGLHVERDLRAAFHDHWNLLAALSNYVHVLGQGPPLAPESARAVDGLRDTLLKLESRTDRLRADVLSALGAGSTRRPPRPARAAPDDERETARPRREHVH